MTDQRPAPVFRIAPTPSGFIHRGNAANFLLVWLFATVKGGRILLRIDDLDRERIRPEYLSDVFRSLEKLGINCDLGPTGPDDFNMNWSQFTRMDLYRNALEILKSNPESFACSCTRSELIERHNCTCKSGIKNKDDIRHNYKITLILDPKALMNDFFVRSQHKKQMFHRTDLVYLRKNGQPAYHTASIVDDVHFGVTHLVRGADLLESSLAQLALAVAMRQGDYLTIKHAHHPLILDLHGEKLAKSAGIRSAEKMNQTGWDTEQISATISKWLNLGSIGNKNELLDAVRSTAIGNELYQW